MEDQNDQVRSLLAEIRDLQRDLLLAFREQSKRTFELQQIQAARQKRIASVYYLVLVLVLPLVTYLAYSLYRSH